MCDLDDVLYALADSRRRQAVRCLRQHHTVSLPDLAEHLAEHEEGDPVTRISREQVRDIYFSLYYEHVPTLEDANLVAYEQADDRVACTDETTAALTRVRDQVTTLLNAS